MSGGTSWTKPSDVYVPGSAARWPCALFFDAQERPTNLSGEAQYIHVPYSIDFLTKSDPHSTFNYDTTTVVARHTLICDEPFGPLLTLTIKNLSG
jgi:hypothetical protein